MYVYIYIYIYIYTCIVVTWSWEMSPRSYRTPRLCKHIFPSVCCIRFQGAPLRSLPFTHVRLILVSLSSCLALRSRIAQLIRILQIIWVRSAVVSPNVSFIFSCSVMQHVASLSVCICCRDYCQPHFVRVVYVYICVNICMHVACGRISDYISVSAPLQIYIHFQAWAIIGTIGTINIKAIIYIYIIITIMIIIIIIISALPP